MTLPAGPAASAPRYQTSQYTKQTALLDFANIHCFDITVLTESWFSEETDSAACLVCLRLYHVEKERRAWWCSCYETKIFFVTCRSSGYVF